MARSQAVPFFFMKAELPGSFMHLQMSTLDVAAGALAEGSSAAVPPVLLLPLQPLTKTEKRTAAQSTEPTQSEKTFGI
jgi:hypothetical protein